MTSGGPNGTRISILRVAVAALALAVAFFPALVAPPAEGQTFKVLYAFQGGTDGANPAGRVMVITRLQ
jgi:hypothetical protein